jgi:hypothetical protein
MSVLVGPNRTNEFAEASGLLGCDAASLGVTPPEDLNPHQHRRENIKYCTVITGGMARALGTTKNVHTHRSLVVKIPLKKNGRFVYSGIGPAFLTKEPNSRED